MSEQNQNIGQQSRLSISGYLPANTENDPHLLMNSKKEYQCACETCTCGKHRCPAPHIKGEFETSYESQYKPIHQKITVTHPPPYTIKERHYNPDALRTRYKETFVTPQPYQNEQLNRSRLENIGMSTLRPHVPFVGSSSYQEQFKPFQLKHPINPEDPYINRREKIPDYGFYSPVKFQDGTSYKAFFGPPSPIKLQKSPYPEYKKPQVPFYGSSSYKQQFKQLKMTQPQSYQSYSQSLSRAPKVKFEGSSTYKELFKEYQMEKPIESGGSKCALEEMNYPQANFMNSSPHIYNEYRRK